MFIFITTIQHNFKSVFGFLLWVIKLIIMSRSNVKCYNYLLNLVSLINETSFSDKEFNKYSNENSIF